MNTLFSVGSKYPEGFQYVPEFLTVQEETNVTAEISKISLHTFMFQGFEAKRKVASFGYDYNFEKKNLTKGKEIPGAFHNLIKKVAVYLDIPQEQFAELLVTEYPVGSVINWHRDASPFDVIVGISLMANCIFRLRPHDKMKQGRGSIISCPLIRRSLYVINGPARSEWQHSIAPVKETRYSITLRTLKN